MKKTMKTKVGIFLILLLAVAAGVWFFNLRAKSRDAIRNIVLISLDTCRGDHLSCYGYSRKTTPNIDAVAAEGVLFEHVVSTVPLTLPAHSSMLTGTIPPYHGVHMNIDYRLGDSNVTLAETLKAGGFATGAVIGAFVLDSKFGLKQGFDYYSDKFDEPLESTFISERRGGETSRYACKWLTENAQQPFFLFVHYYDPHFPYEPPERFSTDYSDDLYAGEIAYTDECVGEVIETLKKLDLYDSTLLIITADHGEALGEHQEREHSYFIYEAAIRVPLIIKGPSIAKGVRVGETVGLIDIVPTVEALVEIPATPAVQGRDLSGYLRKAGHSEDAEFYYCESLMAMTYQCNPLLGVVGNNWKYIRSTRPELYDLGSDTDEKNNLIDAQPHRSRLMEGYLQEMLTASVGVSKDDSKLVLDAQSRAKLESLGYLSGDGIDESFEIDKSKSDAKDMIKFHEKKGRATTYILREQLDKAEETCLEMIAECPNIPYSYFMLGDIYLRTAELEKAAHYFNETLALDPQHFKAYRGLGNAFSRQRKFEESIGYFKKSISLNPDFADTRNELAIAYANLGKLDEAIEQWQFALRLGAGDPQIHINLAEALIFTNRIDEAIKHWQESLKSDPANAKTHRDLAGALLRTGNVAQAIDHYSESLRFMADQPDIEEKLAELYFVKRQLREAIEHWERSIKLKPNSPAVLNNLAWILATHEKNEFHDPTKALEYAKKACELTDFKKAAFLDTLSVAYAATGKFSEAIETAEKALQLYQDSGQDQKSEEIKGYIELFRKEQPYREKQ